MLKENILTRMKRQRRALRVRSTLRYSGHPRLSVFRSSKHLFAQIIDDRTGATMLGVGSYSKEFRAIKDKKEVARRIGLKLAELSKAFQLDRVVFDRGKYKYHGRVAALAEGAREGGLTF